MKLLVTGSTGFLGQAVVREALRLGHTVRAAVRPATDVERVWPGGHARLEIARIDLRRRQGLADACRGVDAVIHLAAVKMGDFYDQMVGTVVATENLLAAMDEAGCGRLVLCSTFSVYDYMRPRSGRVVDEDFPLEPDPDARDEYAKTKLLQEQMVRDHAESTGMSLTVIRPGVIYGADNLPNGWTGQQLGEKRWVRIGANAQVPLTYVEHCAEAHVLAAVKDEAVGRTYNIVDADPPTQRRYIKLLQKKFVPRPRVFPVNWTLARSVARLGWLFNRVFLGGRAKVPSILVPCRLHARAKPYRYNTQRPTQELGWSMRWSLEEAVDRALQIERGELVLELPGGESQTTPTSVQPPAADRAEAASV
ncbi:MAG: NAD-dependent epimerase/dehydratase family protein [Phycisphaerales bacterium JB063]